MTAVRTPLQTFLADRDVPCPECGFNLCGCGVAIHATGRHV
jgi:hypothetical protein